jgi:hypothetical protein
MCVVDPRSGAKFHSLISLKRHFGLAPPAHDAPAASGGWWEGGGTGGARAPAEGEGEGEGGEGGVHETNDLSNEQVLELLNAVEEMRRKDESTDATVGRDHDLLRISASLTYDGGHFSDRCTGGGSSSRCATRALLPVAT